MKNSICLSWSLITLLNTIAPAQSILFHDLPADHMKFRLRFMHPSYQNDRDLSFLSGVYDLQANVAVSPKWNIVASLPYATSSITHTDFTGDPHTASRKSFGNFYIGAQHCSQTDSARRTIGSVGLFFPTASDEPDNANGIGIMTNWHELHRFAPNTLTIYANVASHFHTGRRLFFGFELGPNIWIDTGPGQNKDTEFVIHYGLTAGSTINNLTLNTELVGQLFLSAGGDSFSDRLYHALAFGAQYIGWPLRPGLFYYLYLKESLSDTISGVLGFSLEYFLE